MSVYAAPKHFRVVDNKMTRFVVTFDFGTVCANGFISIHIQLIRSQCVFHFRVCVFFVVANFTTIHSSVSCYFMYTNLCVYRTHNLLQNLIAFLQSRAKY